MAFNIPNVEPKVLTAGDTWKWNRAQDARFPVSEGWAYTYFLNQLDGETGKLEIVGTPGTADYAFVVAAAATLELPPGTYKWHLKASKAGPPVERYSVRRGVLTIRPDPDSADAGAFETYEAQTLRLVETALKSLAEEGLASYEIHGRVFTSLDVKELRRWRTSLVETVRLQRNPGRFGRTIEMVNGPVD